MTTPSAKVVADSISMTGDRLTTVEVTHHRWVLAELNTHRVLSRNSASSRAIPARKQIAKVRESPAEPIVWRSEQKGMQGGEPLDGPAIDKARSVWLEGARSAAEMAETLRSLGVHKSIVNRVLEPYLMHTVVITSTAWENFFSQRCSPLAQDEIRVPAELIREVIAKSDPSPMEYGEFHLPYIVDADREEFAGAEVLPDEVHPLCKVSAARCAQLSYLTQPVIENGVIVDPGGARSVQKDLDRYHRLVTETPPHWSPLEHVATPASWNVGRGRVPKFGNFVGWKQLRRIVEDLRGEATYR